MVAAERTKEYTETETEAEYENEATRPDDTWPHDGVVTYDGYSTRYRPGLDLVLRDVSFSVNSAEQVRFIVTPIGALLAFYGIPEAFDQHNDQ